MAARKTFKKDFTEKERERNSAVHQSEDSENEEQFDALVKNSEKEKEEPQDSFSIGEKQEPQASFSIGAFAQIVILFYQVMFILIQFQAKLLFLCGKCLPQSLYIPFQNKAL